MKTMNSKELEFAEVISIKPAAEFRREPERRPPTGRLPQEPQPAYMQPAPPRPTEGFARRDPKAPIDVEATPVDVYTQPVPPPQFRIETKGDELPPPKPSKSAQLQAVAEAYEMPKVKPFTRPLRVLHLTNVETTNYYINSLCDYTDRRAITYIVATLGKEGSFTKDLDKRGIQMYALDCRQRSQYPKALYRLQQIIQKERIDIVHTHLIEPTFLGMLAAKWHDRAIVVTRHHSDAIYQLPSTFKRDVYLKLEDWINRNAHHIIAPSQMVRDILTRREHVPEEKVSLIPYGQTLDRFDAIKSEQVEKLRAELGMRDRLSLLCVSRLHWEKGHRYLLEAFALLRDEGLDANLYLLGIGPERELLENLARELDVYDRTIFLGWRDDALAVMAAADVVVHASLQEALPSVVIEALMLERPLVVTDVSGVRDIVGNSKHGIIVPPHNTEALHSALGWTTQNLEQARERARVGRKFILEYMGAERVAREYFNIYRRVMKVHLQKVAAKQGKISADTRQILEEAE